MTADMYGYQGKFLSSCKLQLRISRPWSFPFSLTIPELAVLTSTSYLFSLWAKQFHFSSASPLREDRFWTCSWLRERECKRALIEHALTSQGEIYLCDATLGPRSQKGSDLQNFFLCVSNGNSLWDFNSVFEKEKYTEIPVKMLLNIISDVFCGLLYLSDVALEQTLCSGDPAGMWETAGLSSTAGWICPFRLEQSCLFEPSPKTCFTLEFCVQKQNTTFVTFLFTYYYVKKF